MASGAAVLQRAIQNLTNIKREQAEREQQIGAIRGFADKHGMKDFTDEELRAIGPQKVFGIGLQFLKTEQEAKKKKEQEGVERRTKADFLMNAMRGSQVAPAVARTEGQPTPVDSETFEADLDQFNLMGRSRDAILKGAPITMEQILKMSKREAPAQMGPGEKARLKISEGHLDLAKLNYKMAQERYDLQVDEQTYNRSRDIIKDARQALKDARQVNREDVNMLRADLNSSIDFFEAQLFNPAMREDPAALEQMGLAITEDYKKLRERVRTTVQTAPIKTGPKGTTANTEVVIDQINAAATVEELGSYMKELMTTGGQKDIDLAAAIQAVAARSRQLTGR